MSKQVEYAAPLPTAVHNALVSSERTLADDLAYLRATLHQARDRGKHNERITCAELTLKAVRVQLFIERHGSLVICPECVPSYPCAEHDSGAFYYKGEETEGQPSWRDTLTWKPSEEDAFFLIVSRIRSAMKGEA